MTPRFCRSVLLALSLLAPLWSGGAATGTSQVPASPPQRAVEFTFLKSAPGQRARLQTFIERNWFAMDRIARAQGLIAAYSLYETGTDEGPWNVLVAVTYMDSRGYEGVAAEFEQIRRAHQNVPVEGKQLAELGQIVESKRVFEAMGGRASDRE